ncbi:MAG: helix-turn-helix domain-containing protein [Thermomicrobiales bacterium]
MDTESSASRLDRLTLNIEDVARLLGINRSTAYDLARRDSLPVPVIRLGRRMVVSRRAMETLLGVNVDSCLGGDAA